MTETIITNAVVALVSAIIGALLHKRHVDNKAAK